VTWRRVRPDDLARGRWVAGGVSTLLLAASTSLHAQSSAALDAAGSRLQFGGGDASSVVSLAPSVRWEMPRASAYAAGTWATFGKGIWSAQGTLGGSMYGPVVLGLRPEVGAAMTGTTQEGGGGTNQWFGAARLHYAGARVGVWGGGTLGRAYDGVANQGVTAGEVGAWARAGTAMAAVTAMPTRIGDSLRHTDVVGAVRVESGAWDAAAFAGWRSWARPDAVPGATWAGANVAFWLSDHLALVAGAGTYPIDWAQGLPSGRFATLSVRVAMHRPTAHRAIGTRLLPPGVIPVVAVFEAVPDSGDRWTLRVQAPPAARVEIMGDFTHWEPVALDRDANGRWSARFPIAPGIHRMNVRVDGGPWGVPPGVPVLHDEFSGAVGMLVIPAR
jgi:hypothetical protein